MKNKFWVLLLLSVTMSQSVFSQGNIHEQSSSYQWPEEQDVVQKLHQWQDLKFGVLIHWGIYSVPGIVESWSICDENWITRDTTQTFQQYRDGISACQTSFVPVSLIRSNGLR